MTEWHQPGSSSVEVPDYWWYRARSALLESTLGPYLGTPARLLDVGSADGPSVAWMRRAHEWFAVDLDPRGLVAGRGVRASAAALPFPAATFDVVGAFDVIEHCPSEDAVIGELARVLMPGGRLLASVPAYQWAWTDHDVRAGHYRRYTRRRLVAAVERSGLTVLRATHAFAGVFPFFAAQRLAQRLRRRSSEDHRLPQVSAPADRLFMSLSAAEARWLRGHDVSFGSSVFLAAVKPQPTG